MYRFGKVDYLSVGLSTKRVICHVKSKDRTNMSAIPFRNIKGTSMKLSTVNPRTAAMLALVLFALSACVVAPAHRHAAYTTYPVYSQPAPPSAVDTVEVAPPVPQVEVIPAVPFARAVWVGGFWRWQGGRHYWVPGHYIQPVAGHRFVPHRWENNGGRWVLRGGFWIR
jgi:hypothetical protein